MAIPEFASGSRLMLIAPHPDDEALACSIILQRAIQAGIAIRVIYATDGDDNPWPQRVLERKWRLNAADRKRWGNVRRSEALAALRMLGVHARDAHFLALRNKARGRQTTANAKNHRTLQLLWAAGMIEQGAVKVGRA